MRTYLVYMSNHTDRRDDEVFKVRASNSQEAKSKAARIGYGRFSANWCMSYISKNKQDREFLKSYRWWATDHTNE